MPRARPPLPRQTAADPAVEVSQVNRDDPKLDPKASRRRRWALLVALVFMAGLGLVLMFLLTLATRNRAFYEQNFGWLAMVNVAVAVLLALIIVWLAVRLYLRFRLGRFGSRLLLKLAAIIGLVGVLPGVLIYTVSYQFVSRSIESWFDVRVESALAAGLNLGRTTLDTMSADLGDKTRMVAEELARQPHSSALLRGWRLARPASRCWPWSARRASTWTMNRGTCRWWCRCPRPWSPTRWRSRWPTASTRSAPWAGKACAACTSAP